MKLHQFLAGLGRLPGDQLLEIPRPRWLMIDVLHGSIPRNALVLTETHAGHAGNSAIET